MKRKVLLILFILNTLTIVIYYIPLLQEITYVFFDKEAAAIDIIGGADGPTAIFITSRLSWFPILLFSIEIILGLYLLISRSKK
jgi:Na+-transporting methylmalonyl-CoA/oxaloacetate decarboxylase beta subunit